MLLSVTHYFATLSVPGNTELQSGEGDESGKGIVHQTIVFRKSAWP